MAEQPIQSKPDAKVILYWLDKSRSQRILWLLEEINVDYELKVFKRGKDFLAPPELKEVHPLGKSPVVGIQTPGAEKPLILAESGAIVEYLTDYFGKHLVPRRYPEGKEGVIGAEREEWLRYRFLMHYAEGSLMTPMVVSLITNRIKNGPAPFFLKPIVQGVGNKVEESYVKPNFKTHLAYLEDLLATSPNNGEFFCGAELSAADIMMIYGLEAATQRAPITEQSHPKLYGWVRRMQAREAYQRAGQKVSEASGEKYIPVSDLKL